MPTEAQTRKQDIDDHLKKAGWTVVPCQEGLDIDTLDHHAVEEFPTNDGPADYLLVCNGRPLGIVEAMSEKSMTRLQNR